MGIERPKSYNEPVEAAGRDVMPASARVRPERLGAAVHARLMLESQLRICGVQPKETIKSVEFGPAHRKVLVRMLSEVDSPLSASLRSAAAAAAGRLRLAEAAPLLRAMATDENEDARTRLHAIDSYIALAGAKAARDLKAILSSSDPVARSTALIAALRTNLPQLAKLAHAHLQKEKDAGVRTRVVRNVSALNMETTTVSSVAETRPATGRPRKTRKTR
jgi:hypothetical protein